MQYLAAIIAFICWQSCQGLDLRPYNVTALSMFVSNDLNQDGFFTLDEMHSSFTVYDSNHDGRVTRHEYTSYVNLHTPTLHDLSHALYDDYDVDHDHHLDEHDFQNLFNIMDIDKDHRVSALEWEQYWVNHNWIFNYPWGRKEIHISQAFMCSQNTYYLGHQIKQFVKYEHLHGHVHAGG